MRSPIRVGIVGANAERGWARDAHIAALTALPQFTIAAISARTHDIADKAAKAFGASRAFGNSLELVRDPAIDLVVVTVKVPEHRAIVLAALDAGKHVYCEWPLGRDLAEAREMSAAVCPGGHVMIGLQGLSAPVIREGSRLVQNGRIGRPIVLRAFCSAAAWGNEAPPHYTYLQDKRNGATLETIGGGHMLAAIQALVGQYTDVDARNSTLRKSIRVTGTDSFVTRTCADHMLVLGGHDSACVSTLEVSGGASTRPALFEIVGESGWIRISGTVPGTYQIPRLQLEASFELEPMPAPVAPGLSGPPVNVAEAYARFAADIIEGTKTVPDFNVALSLTHLLDTIDLASSTGQRGKL